MEETRVGVVGLLGEGSRYGVWRCRRQGASAHPEPVCVVFPVDSASTVTSLGRKERVRGVVCSEGPHELQGCYHGNKEQLARRQMRERR